MYYALVLTPSTTFKKVFPVSYPLPLTLIEEVNCFHASILLIADLQLMELVIQVDEPLDHLHPIITKSVEKTQVITSGLRYQEREDRASHGELITFCKRITLACLGRKSRWRFKM